MCNICAHDYSIPRIGEEALYIYIYSAVRSSPRILAVGVCAHRFGFNIVSVRPQLVQFNDERRADHINRVDRVEADARIYPYKYTDRAQYTVYL